MLYNIIIQELAKYQQTPKSIVNCYERLDFGISRMNDQALLLSIFHSIFHKLNHYDATRDNLKDIASTPDDLIEWFVFQTYVIGND